MTDSGDNKVMRVDLTSGEVSEVGSGISYPRGVSVDSSGTYLYVADNAYYGNSKVKRVSLVKAIANLGLLSPPRAFSLDLDSVGTASITEFPSQPMASLPGVISPDGSCEGVAEDRMCLSLVYSEFNAETSTLWLDLLNAASGYHFLQAHSASSQPPRPVVLSSSVSRRALLAAIKTSLLVDATVLFTTRGALSSAVSNFYPLAIFPTFTAFVVGKTIQDLSKIPPTSPGSSTRYFLISYALSDDYQAVIYDTFTDTVVSSNKANGAPTHYMLAYTWGACSGNVTRNVVELTFSNDYSNECQLPSTGLYYQSENRYFSIPISCLGIAYDKLLTDSPEVKANMKSLVDSTCAASIPKVCQQQYETNPPFSCVADIFSSPLTILFLAASNTIALYGVFSFLAGFFIRRVYAQYKASIEEMKELNPREELGVLVCSLIASICGFSAFDVVDEDEDDGKGSSGETAAASMEMVGCYKCDTEKADADSASSSWSDIDSIFSPN